MLTIVIPINRTTEDMINIVEQIKNLDPNERVRVECNGMVLETTAEQHLMAIRESAMNRLFEIGTDCKAGYKTFM